MKKQLLIVGIITLCVCVWLGGCDSPTDRLLDNRTGGSFLPPDFRVSGLHVEDNCGTALVGEGTVWVNFTVTNHGSGGSAVVHVQVYQGILDYQTCGNGIIYNNTHVSYIYVGNEESKDIRGIFSGIDCLNGSNCYGYRYWFFSPE